MSLSDRCDLVATVLTHRAPAEQPGQSARVAPIEDERVVARAFENGKPVVAVVLRRKDGQEHPWFEPGEACGDRLTVAGPPRPLRLEVIPGRADTFSVKLSLDELSDGPTAGFVPIVADAARKDGEWVLSRDGREQARLKRATDPVPRASRRTPALPPGRAEAAFELDTGGDMMGAAPREAGLVLVVRHGNIELRQTIASCSEPALGSALGGVAPQLAVALCDGRYTLVATPGEVRVDRDTGRSSPTTVTRVALPDSRMRASAPARRP